MICLSMIWNVSIMRRLAASAVSRFDANCNGMMDFGEFCAAPISPCSSRMLQQLLHLEHREAAHMEQVAQLDKKLNDMRR